jgi:hypothetical protein
MNHRYFLLCLCLAGLTTTSYGQVGVHVGVTTAYNATFVLDNGLSEAPRYRSQMTYNWAPVGFNIGVDFSRKFGLSLESILSRQGQVFQIIDIADKVVGERNIQYEYLQLPLLMRFMGQGNSAVRGNFNLGPQLSILTNASELIKYSASTQTFPKGAALPAGASDIMNHPDGTVTATVPAQSPKELLSKEAQSFRNAEFQIAAAVGLDIDLSRHLYLSTQIRGNYSVTDTRNGDVIEALKQGDSSDVFGKRANMLIGVQTGVHYMFGTTRSFRYKGAKTR